jgi:hypothetical protein
MSLSSRVANLFSGSTNAQQTCNDFGLVDNGLPEGKPTFADVKLGTESFHSGTMSPKADEDEGRPPYLHVRAL